VFDAEKGLYLELLFRWRVRAGKKSVVAQVRRFKSMCALEGIPTDGNARLTLNKKSL